MADTSIQWTDKVWNPVRGCVKVSPGCAHCYAETFAERFRGVKGHPYEQGFDLRLVPEKLDEPLRWKKPRRIFVNSMSDLFQDGVPDEYIDRAFAVMALAPRHTFQILTKRADRMRAYFAPGQYRDVKVADAAKALHTTVRPFALPSEAVFEARPVAFNLPWMIHAWPLPNVWLGVSVENQHFADERIPLLLQTPTAVRFISAEPLLEHVDLTNVRLSNGGRVHALGGTVTFNDPPDGSSFRGLDWVIVGGESGPGARPFHIKWARAIVDQCRGAGVACFVKQLGAHVIDRNDAGFEGDTPRSWPMDTKTRDLTSNGWQGDPVRVRLRKKAGDPQEWPEDLRIREFPVGRRAPAGARR